MTSISLDRYLGISDPLKQHDKSRSIVALKIFVVWILTGIISSPLVVLALNDKTNILNDNNCAINNRVIMAFTYVFTTRLLTQQATLLSGTSQDSDHFNGLRRTMISRKRTLRVQSNNASMESPFKTRNKFENNGHLNGHDCSFASLSSRRHQCSPVGFAETNLSPLAAHSISRQETLKICVENSSYHNESFELESGSGEFIRFALLPFSRATSRLANICSQTSIISRFTSSGSGKFGVESDRHNKVKKRKAKAKQELASERKATRVLAVVFVCFFVCWTPFFTFNFILAFCGLEKCRPLVPNWAASLFLWLGYSSSTLNPIIYTIFNRHFRQTFIHILRCHCCVHSRNLFGIEHLVLRRSVHHSHGCRCLKSKDFSSAAYKSRLYWQESLSIKSGASSSRSTVCRLFRNPVTVVPPIRIADSKRTLKTQASLHPGTEKASGDCGFKSTVTRRASYENGGEYLPSSFYRSKSADYEAVAQVQFSPFCGGRFDECYDSCSTKSDSVEVMKSRYSKIQNMLLNSLTEISPRSPNIYETKKRFAPGGFGFAPLLRRLPSHIARRTSETGIYKTKILTNKKKTSSAAIAKAVQISMTIAKKLSLVEQTTDRKQETTTASSGGQLPRPLSCIPALRIDDDSATGIDCNGGDGGTSLLLNHMRSPIN